MKRLIRYCLLSLLFLPYPAKALEVSHTAMDGSDSIPAEYFRKWYHRTDLIYYLEALNDHVIVENHTPGQWWLPDRLSLAVAGLPCTQTNYTIDGMRTDDRFAPGNTVFVPNMQQYNLLINTHTGQLRDLPACLCPPPSARRGQRRGGLYLPRQRGKCFPAAPVCLLRSATPHARERAGTHHRGSLLCGELLQGAGGWFAADEAEYRLFETRLPS